MPRSTTRERSLSILDRPYFCMNHFSHITAVLRWRRKALSKLVLLRWGLGRAARTLLFGRGKQTVGGNFPKTLQPRKVCHLDTKTPLEGCGHVWVEGGGVEIRKIFTFGCWSASWPSTFRVWLGEGARRNRPGSPIYHGLHGRDTQTLTLLGVGQHHGLPHLGCDGGVLGGGGVIALSWGTMYGRIRS